ncbi:hypothetical protein [Salinispora vitiensis]|uniref:hypothetical protein n=1 Tax=Salinispora vitiensis TaxID=999544 RepID=UPI000476AE90|nr:hypothetical protein [Salinispora vitiensis]
MSAHPGPGVCPGCLTVPGRDHGVACPAVEGPRHAVEAVPEFVRIALGLLVGLLIGVGLWVCAQFVWSLT